MKKDITVYVYIYPENVGKQTNSLSLWHSSSSRGWVLWSISLFCLYLSGLKIIILITLQDFWTMFNMQFVFGIIVVTNNNLFLSRRTNQFQQKLNFSWLFHQKLGKVAQLMTNPLPANLTILHSSARVELHCVVSLIVPSLSGT